MPAWQVSGIGWSAPQEALLLPLWATCVQVARRLFILSSLLINEVEQLAHPL